MDTDSLIKALIVAVLGTGGATFLWTAVRSVIAFRDSAEAREDRAVARLERYEGECRQQLAYERLLSAYWCQVAGIYAHALAVNGIEEPPMPRRPDGFTPGFAGPKQGRS